MARVPGKLGRDPSGRDIRKATKAKTKREAEIVLANLLKDVDTGTYELKQRQRKVTFFEICEDFLAYGQVHKRSWQRDQGSIKHLKGFFGDCLAKDIKPAIIEDYILHRKKSVTPKGNQPTPATINRELACLRTIYNRAVRNGKCKKNPMNHVKLLKENNKRDWVLTREELSILLKESPEHLKSIIIAAHETGMRSGEIFSLRWEQVDLKNQLIKLNPEQTKTNEGRKIPISLWLHQTLKRIKPKSGLVFNYKRQFNQICKTLIPSSMQKNRH